MALNVVIMAGGKGERLWPLSLENKPKQLLDFDGQGSLLCKTVERCLKLTAADNIYIVVSQAIADEVSAQLPGIKNIVAEPVGRNTAPCIAYMAGVIAKRDPEGSMAVFPSDHLIADEDAFVASLEFATRSLNEFPDYLLTLGIVPTHAETGYGYIAPRQELNSDNGFTLRHVTAFHEKPDAIKAAEYIESGYLWNAGMFVFKLESILKNFAQHLPELYRLLLESLSRPNGIDYFFSSVESISIDYGIMERSDRVGVIPVDFGWDDIGSWDALGAVLDGDAAGNVARGDVMIEDSSNNVCFGADKKIVLLGVDDLVVVEGPDAILVCPRSRAQDVSGIAKRVKD